MPTSSAGVETELMKTRYDAHVFTVAATCSSTIAAPHTGY